MINESSMSSTEVQVEYSSTTLVRSISCHGHISEIIRVQFTLVRA